MILNASAITCRRGGANVLRDVSFLLHGGQVMAVTGANGSGKTTLLRMLAGLNDPAAGSLTLDGRPFESTLRRDSVHWIGPDTPLKPGLTLFENLSFWAALQGAPRDTVMPALRRFGIDHLAARAARSLSTGQRRRAMLARLLLGRRALWVLDEPETALDSDGRALLKTVLHEHGAAHGAAIIASHDPQSWMPVFTLALQNQDTAATFSRMPPSDSAIAHRAAQPGIGAVMLATLQRDLTIAWRSPGDIIQPVILFLLMAMLFPLGLGPATPVPLTGGLLVLAALFAALLTLDRMFADDATDGTLDAVMTTPAPLPAFAAGRIAGHWLATGAPVVAVTPLAAIMLGTAPGAALSVAAAMIPVTLLLSLTGAALAALVLGARRGAVLLALLAAPLYIPVLIFGAAALGDPGAALPVTLLWAMVAAMVPAAPLLAAGCLSLTRD